MPLTPQSLESKPYNVCIDCVHIGKDCDGPNFLAMSTERWCEWCHLRKEYLGWTNAQVAAASGLSEISVARIMSGSSKDPRFNTMQAITKALINGTWGQYPCAMAALTEKEEVYVDNPAIIEQCKQLQAALDNANAEHKANVAAARSEDQRKIEFLREQIKFKEEQMRSKDKLLDERRDFLKRKDRWIAILASSLAVTLLVIIAALVIDILNSDVGFFWIDRLSDVFNGVAHEASGGFVNKLL